jgi:hypothetical protein
VGEGVGGRRKAEGGRHGAWGPPSLKLRRTKHGAWGMEHKAQGVRIPSWVSLSREASAEREVGGGFYVLSKPYNIFIINIL